MRRLRFFLVAIAWLAGANLAQAESWYTGVKAGIHVGDSYGDDSNSTGSRTLFAGGFLGGVRFDAHFGARLEFLYVQKGDQSEFQSPFDPQPTQVKTRLDYVELPLLFVYSLPAGEAFHVDLFAGPTFDFQVHAENEVNGVTGDIGPVTSNFDFCGTIGAGIRYDRSGVSLVADGRYVLGTMSTIDVDGFSPDVKNRGAEFLAGIEIPLGAH